MKKNIIIVAVVVTYNRLALLKECITSLKNQTSKLDEIIVINNDSNDGTKKWLNEQKDLTKIHQANLGGAGGFHTGLKTAYEKKYDWIWVMDDDGLPERNALEELLKYNKMKVGVLNSLVVSKSNPDELVFGLEDYLENKFYTKVTQLKNNTSINGANFFNGTLISKNTISKIGLPNPLFFIYGDEFEFFLRTKTRNIEIKTIPSSIILHPEQKHLYLGKGKFLHKLIEFNSLYVKYLPRNLMAIWYLYEEYTFRRLIKTYAYDLFGLLFIQKKISYALKYFSSIFVGIPFMIKIKKYEKFKT